MSSYDLDRLQALPPWDWPPDAGETIRSALEGGAREAEERLLAADLAGNTVVLDDDLVEVLLAVAEDGDEPEELRATAAIALGPVLDDLDTGFLDDPEERGVSPPTAEAIRGRLRKLYMDPEEPKLVRRRVLEASIRYPEDWHRGAARAAYHDGDPEWKITGVFCMGFLGGFDEEILEALDSGDEAIHFEAVRAAGHAEVDEAWPHLVRVVRSADTERDLLFAAIEAVASLRPGEAGRVLDDFADSDDEEIAWFVEDALSMARALAAAPEEEEDVW